MRNFRVQMALRLLALLVTAGGALYLGLSAISYASALVLLVFASYQLYLIFRYVDRTNRDLARFLESIRYSDFSQSFSAGGRGKSFSELSRSFSEVVEDFRAARAEKEENVRYLQTVLQHIGVALISFRPDGSVGLVNNAARRLLRTPHLKNIHALEAFSPELVETLFRLRAGEKALVQVTDADELLQLSIQATEFKLRGDLFTLVSIQNIQAELEEKEIEAWQKLTRVLTHEIMNSITPVASLAGTINEMLAELPVEAGDGPVAKETLADVKDAVRTIERRSESLLGFVNAYRQLTRVPKPNFRIVPVSVLFESVEPLYRTQAAANGVVFKCSVEPPSLDATVDPDLVEQVLINLLKNAFEAVAGRTGAQVSMTAHLDERGRVTIQVTDNGPGIVKEAIDKVFIPFFTTKKEGSGIGLSLSREIMRQHSGTLSVYSEPDHQTVFTLRF